MSALTRALGDIRRAVLCAVHRRPVAWGDLPPTISFTFDDFPRSAYLVGGRILRDAGAAGTYYTAAALAGSKNNLGEQFLKEDLIHLLEDGHELASHTYSHISCRKTAYDDFRADVLKGRAALLDICGAADSGNFAYPYGAVTAYAKGRLGPSLVSCRGTVHGINYPDADLNLLRANPLYGGNEIVPKASRLIERVSHQGGWLIFYTHDVQNDPSTYGCTPSAFGSIVSLAARSGARLLSVAQVMQELATPSSRESNPPVEVLESHKNAR